MKYLFGPGLLVMVLLSSTGCVNHIRPYKPKKRTYELPVPHSAYDDARSSGSLFDPHGVGGRLTTDARAQGVNDLVVVVIDERANATRGTGTSTGRSEEQSASLNNFLGLMTKLDKEYPDLNSATALDIAHESTFSGSGQTSRSDKVEATVPAMVRQVLPNGSLFVEGHRVVLLNNEENHFYISGVIRPEDIDGKGQVLSSRMADAQIEFTGRGDLTAGSSKGWASKILDYVWPF